MARDRDWRDWTLALKKCVIEGECRACRAGSPDPAHIIGRDKDPVRYPRPLRPGRAGFIEARVVLADAIVPLCRGCHNAYDDHNMPILYVLRAAEIARAITDAGGLIPMLNRTLAVDHQRPLEARLNEYLTLAQVPAVDQAIIP